MDERGRPRRREGGGPRPQPRSRPSASGQALRVHRFRLPPGRGIGFAPALTPRTHPIVGGPVIMEPQDDHRKRDAASKPSTSSSVSTRWPFLRITVSSAPATSSCGAKSSSVSADSGAASPRTWSGAGGPSADGYALAFVPGRRRPSGATRLARTRPQLGPAHARELPPDAREKRFGRLAWLAKRWLVLASPLPHAAQGPAMRAAPVRGRAALRGRRCCSGSGFYRFLESHRVMSKVHDGPELPARSGRHVFAGQDGPLL